VAGQGGKAIQPVRGMNDVLPPETGVWQWVERTAAEILEAYGYGQLRVPVIERTELFARSIGEVTDIVEKEMYTFPDRNGESLTLRPEATASCVRAAITHGLLHNQQQRFWYAGPMFRYERPQKGRYRQFHQIGAEAFGFAGPDIDAELILMSARLWRALGIPDLVLEINSLGTPESREGYRHRLVEYFSDHRDQLDADSLRRLEQNPLRILDTKNPDLQALVAGAPAITDHLDPESSEHFDALRGMLADAGVEARVNSRLVRGLDYYTRTVFEWLTDRLGAQAAVCSGGRYDGLVTQLGGRDTPAIGWALGMERLVEIVQLAAGAPAFTGPHVFLLPVGGRAVRSASGIAERMRDEVPGIRVTQNCGSGSMKSGMKRADRSGAALAVIVGEDELATGTLTIKPLRDGGEQRQLAQPQALRWLAEWVDDNRKNDSGG
jgi:histidyl-tRNA synthetase